MPLERIGPFVYSRHAAVLPALDAQGYETAHHPVLIVGGGPVGLAIALGLAHWGVSSVVIEADDAVCEGSRAACISGRSLEILDRLGVADAFMRKGLPWTHGRSYYGRDEVYVLEMPSAPGDKFPPMINLEQYYIEDFLLTGIAAVNARSPGRVQLRWASKVQALEQTADGVRVEISNALGHYRSRADWLVAADGGQSFVRTQLGLELKGVSYQGRYAIVDIELASSHPTERRAWFDPPWARGTTILMHRQPDNIWRIDYQLAAGQDAALVMQPQQIRSFVQTHLDAIGEGHLPWQPVWTSIYRAGAMTLAAYRHGRILFAGNAAHALPIFGVRGLNSGLDDADNLVWKLAAVVQGLGGEALLDSYSSERVAAFHINAASAMRSTEFMSPPNRGFELMREAALSLAIRHQGIARLINPRQTRAISYTDSPLSTVGDAFEAGPPPSAALTNARVGQRYLNELLARTGFTLLVFGHSLAAERLAQESASSVWAALPCTLLALPANGPLAAEYGARDATVYLVRPDGHVCGRWHAPSSEMLLDALERASACETRAH